MSILATDWKDFVANLSIFGGLLAVAYVVLRLAIQHGFNAKLANLKGELDRKLEILKIDHQKLMFDFEAYNSRKHERYPELYKLVEVALGYLMNLRGRRRGINLKNSPKDDIEKHCETLELTQGDIKRILAVWEKNQQKAISAIQEIELRNDYNKAELKWHEANEYFIVNELYFSEEVAAETRKMLDLMMNYWIGLDPIYMGNPEIREENDNSKQQVLEQRTEWKNTMKKEVSPVNKGDS